MKFFTLTCACIFICISLARAEIASSSNETSGSQPQYTELAKKKYGSGLVHMHFPKSAGTTLNDIFNEYYGVNFYPQGPKELFLKQVKSGPYASGHCSLQEIVKHNPANRPIITFLRDPLKRLVSHIRYLKAYHSIPDFQKTRHDPNLNPEKFKGAIELGTTDLNNLEDMKKVLSKNWSTVIPSFHLLSPPGTENALNKVNIDAADKCFDYAMDNLAFIGNAEDLEESIRRLNLALGTNINTEKVTQVKRNVTPSAVEKITNPDVLKFLEEHIALEIHLYNRIIEEQPWRYAKTTEIASEDTAEKFIIQYTFPKDFNPDEYLSREPNLKERAARSCKNDLWACRKWAMENYINEYGLEGKVIPASDQAQ